VNTTAREASVGEAITVGLDLAKSVFQAHGADASGEVERRKRAESGMDPARELHKGPRPIRMAASTGRTHGST
jgi:hypothetical protein